MPQDQKACGELHNAQCGYCELYLLETSHCMLIATNLFALYCNYGLTSYEVAVVYITSGRLCKINHKL